MSAARERILARLRSVSASDAPLPDLPPAGSGCADRPGAFAAALEAAGGQVGRVERAALGERLRTHAEALSATRVVSTIDAFGGDVQVDSIDEPHGFADLDLAIVGGLFGVAENGAVWIPDERLRHRALLFLTQHLILVVEEADLVEDMHAAYARLELEGPAFGCFVSGPSKTADIEQSLVIGAHGARSTIVLLCRESA